jgi:acyl-coenzyme A synthetase/AMP-(fatty) acid ligase
MAATYGWSPRDVLLSTGNLHTMSGLRNPCVAAAVAGSAVVVAGQEVRGSPLALAEAVRRRRTTLLTTVPAALRALLQAAGRCEAGALSSLRAVLSTADRLPEELRAGFEKAFGVTVYNYFGLTETCGLCAGEIPGRSCQGRDTVGHPVGAELRLVAEDGRDASPGQPGELWVRSAHLMLGYFRDEEASRGCFAGDWYRTGDLAQPNPDGSYSLIGRLRQIVKNAQGEILSPVEVEEALRTHPEVADAGACVAPDAGCSGQIAAFVVPRVPLAGPAERERWITVLRRHLLATVGAKRSPARIEVRSRLPRNSNGKLRIGELLRGEDQ